MQLRLAPGRGIDLSVRKRVNFNMPSSKNIAGALSLSLPLIVYFFIADTKRLDLLFLVFVASGITSLTLTGFTLIVKIILSHLFQIPWLKPISLEEIRQRSGHFKLLLQFLFAVENVSMALFYTMASSYFIISFTRN